jgi:4-hydroxy-3-methylbut-2-en-1-yl diphosphate synthase IspG/GcpE
VDQVALAQSVEQALQGVKKQLRVAVMGCVVNGPGEAAGSDLAVVGGKDAVMIYKQGRPVRRVPQDQAITALLDEIARFEAPEGRAEVAGERRYAPRQAKPGQVHGHDEIIQFLEKIPPRR